MTTWAISDIHGHLDVWKKVKNIIAPEDKVYVIGDLVDRGPQSWETFKVVYQDPQAIVMCGNHEDMLINACTDYFKNDESWQYESYHQSIRNGGYGTMSDWEMETCREGWLKTLKKLPLILQYKNIVLTHAGYTPYIDEDDSKISREDLLWDREHYFDIWNSNWHRDDIIIVHGHTPNQHLAEDLRADWNGGAFRYFNNHKICIDSGGFFSGHWTLLNLDTLEDTIITLGV